MKVARFPALCTGRVYSPVRFAWFVLMYVRGWVDTRGIVRPEGLSLKNPYDSIGKRTHDLPVCSAVPPPTAPAKKEVLVYTVLFSHFTAHNMILAICHLKLSFSPQSLSWFIIPSPVVCSKSCLLPTSCSYVHLIFEGTFNTFYLSNLHTI